MSSPGTERPQKERKHRSFRLTRDSYRGKFDGSVAIGRSLAVLVCRPAPFLAAAVPVYALFVAVVGRPENAVPVSYRLLLPVAVLLLTGFLANPVVSVLEARPMGWGDFLRDGARGLFPSIPVAPVLVVAAWGGFQAYVVPGLAVLLLGFLAVPAAACEGLGPWEAVKRSFLLTRRSLFEIFRCLLLIWCGFVLVTILVWFLGLDGSSVLLVLGVPLLLLPAVLPTVIRHEIVRRR